MQFLKTSRAASAACWIGIGAASSGLASCANSVQGIADTQDTGVLNPDTPQGERTGAGFWFVDQIKKSVGFNPAVHPDVEAARYLRCSDTSPKAKDLGPDSSQNVGECGTSRAPSNSPAPALNAGKGNPATKGKSPASLMGTKDAYGQVRFLCDGVGGGVAQTAQCARDFRETRDAASSNPGDGPSARVYLIAGMSLSDRACLSWFDRLQVAETTLNETGDTISASGTLVTTLMSVFHSGTNWIAGTTSLFGFAKQSVDNIDRNYIVATDLASVKYAVQAYRARYRQEIETSDGAWSYYNADTVLTAYQDTCTALSVRRFIAKKVDSSDSASPTQQIYKAVLDKLITETKDDLSVTMTEDTLPLLYAIEFLQPSSDVKTKLQKQLTGGASDKNFRTDASKADFAKKMQAYGLDSYLAALANPLIAATNAKVSQANQAAAASDAAALAAVNDDLETLHGFLPAQPLLVSDDVITIDAIGLTKDAALKRKLAVERNLILNTNGDNVEWAAGGAAAFSAELVKINAAAYVRKKALALVAPPAPVGAVVKGGKGKGGRPAAAGPDKAAPLSISPQFWAVPLANDKRPLNQPPPVTPTT